MKIVLLFFGFSVPVILFLFFLSSEYFGLARTNMDQPTADWTPHIEQYKEDGVVVISQVLSSQEVLLCREGLHADLRSQGVNYSALDNYTSLNNLKKLQSHHSGGVPFFYSPWQLKYCHTNQILFEATRAIWAATWAKGIQHFENPFAPFDPSFGFTFLDSFGVSFRLPTQTAKTFQKTIGLHVDLNPWDKWTSGRR